MCEAVSRVDDVLSLQYGDTTHTLVERTNYGGLFLPGYKPPRVPTDGLQVLL